MKGEMRKDYPGLVVGGAPPRRIVLALQGFFAARARLPQVVASSGDYDLQQDLGCFDAFFVIYMICET